MHDVDLEYFSQVFKALADPTRQRILELLREREEMTVTNIATNFSSSQPTISQHLKVLKDAGALKTRRAGQQIYYRICNIAMYDAMEEFMEVYETEANKKEQ
jgi:ArsR family transcriptional regulator